MLIEPARPPLDTWAIQHFDRRFGYGWYCGKGIIVSQTTIDCATQTGARAYHDFESAILKRHAEDIRSHGGLFVIHDWRTMTDHDPSGRKAWQERMRQHPAGYLRGSVVCLAKASPMLRLAVQAVNLFASLNYGAKVELATDLESTLRRHGLLEAMAPGRR